MRRGLRQCALRWAWAFIVLCCMFAPVPALASCVVSPNEARYELPRVELVTRGVLLNEPLSPWLHPPLLKEFDCKHDLMIFNGVRGEPSALGIFREAGREYTIHDTGVDGVGVVFGARDPRPFGVVSYLAGSEQVGYQGTDHGGGLGLRGYIRFIRLGDLKPGEYTTREVKAGNVYITWSGGRVEREKVLGPVTLSLVNRPICTVTPKTVGMGVVAITQLESAAGARRVPFSIDLMCESDVGQIQFEANPTTTIVNANEGIVMAEGEASGVGLQFTHEDGRPLLLQQLVEFGVGGPSAGELKRAFTARYVRTGGPVTVGSANAGLNIVLRYP